MISLETELSTFEFSVLIMFFFFAGLVFCTPITRMELGDNRVQWKSLMDSPSVASEMRDRVEQTGMRSESLLTSLKQFKVSLSLCLYSYDAEVSVVSEYLPVV